MTIWIPRNTIYINGKSIIDFGYSEIIDFIIFVNTGIAVCLDGIKFTEKGKNIYFVDFNGNTLWQTQQTLKYYSSDTSMDIKENFTGLHPNPKSENTFWGLLPSDGMFIDMVLFDIKTGKIIEVASTKD